MHKAWKTILAVEKYSQWRSDVSKMEVINEKQFIEYTKDGFHAIFTITAAQPYEHWESDMENSDMKGHWIGIFASKGNKLK